MKLILLFFRITESTNFSYEKLKAGCSQDRTLFSLSWDVEELKALNEEGRKLRVEISSLACGYLHS